MIITSSKRNLSDSFLKGNGFVFCERIPKVSLARRVQPEELPLTIDTGWDTLTVDSLDYWLVLHDDETISHPVATHEFMASYKHCYDDGLLSDLQKNVIANTADYPRNVVPFIKFAGVWAKVFSEPVFIQGLEHTSPVEIEAGRVIVIGKDSGEVWNMSVDKFKALYYADGLLVS